MGGKYTNTHGIPKKVDDSARCFLQDEKKQQWKQKVRVSWVLSYRINGNNGEEGSIR